MLRSGILDIASLLDYVKDNPIVPHKEEPVFKIFRCKYEELLKQVDPIPGWYAWVGLSQHKLEYIYIGRSNKEKTSDLQARLKEEFFDEYVAFWATLHDPNVVHNTLCAKNLSIGNKEYRGDIRRSIKKNGANNILWIGLSAMALEENIYVEKYLIYTLQPTANVQGKKKKVDGTKLSIKVLSSLEETVNKLFSIRADCF